HIVERAVLMAQDRQIRAGDLGLTSGGGDSRNLEQMSLEEVEAFLIKKALARNDGNARKAAEALGLSRSAFYRRLQQYGLYELRIAAALGELITHCRLQLRWPLKQKIRIGFPTKEKLPGSQWPLLSLQFLWRLRFFG